MRFHARLNLRASILFLSLVSTLWAADPRVKNIQTLKNAGGRVDWSANRNLIAFDQPGSDGYFDVYTMNPDGSNTVCLTCDKVPPNRHIGNPAWDPTGNWIAFQVQKVAAGPLDKLANPGAGANNDIWVMDAAGTKFYQMTNITAFQGGVLHPHFSHKGDLLMWAERLSGVGGGLYGIWAIRVADFRVTNGIPGISNVRTFQPGDQKFFYETHSFSPDDSKIYFSGNLALGQSELDIDIYSLDLQTEGLVNLTNTLDNWDEHSQISPSGNGIVWMSSTGNGSPRNGNVATDFWIMSPDGSNKVRLTYFNDSTAPEYSHLPFVTCADNSWSPDGTQFVATILTDPINSVGEIVLITLDTSSTTIHSASSAATVAAGSIVSAFGRGLSLSAAATTSTTLPLSLGGVTVAVTDSLGTQRNAPLFYASPGQVNYLVPDGTASGKATAAFTMNGKVASISTLQVAASAPGIYTASQNGKGVAAAYVQPVTQGLTLPYLLIFKCDLSGLNCASTPINLGVADQVYLDLFGTGLRGASNVTVLIGGQTLPVKYSGPQNTYPGLDQVVVLLPKSLAGLGEVDLTVMADGQAANTVRVNLQ